MYFWFIGQRFPVGHGEQRDPVLEGHDLLRAAHGKINSSAMDPDPDILVGSGTGPNNRIRIQNFSKMLSSICFFGIYWPYLK